MIKDSIKQRVLGVDCGLASVGWEVLEGENNRFVHIAGGVIITFKNRDTQMRLKQIFNELGVIIKQYKPSEMAVEELFYFRNNTTIIGVGQARGVILLAGALAGLEIFGYTPLEVKVAVTGYGRSDKKQIQFMVKKLLHFTEEPKPDDWADAIAISICHLNTAKYDRKT